MPAELPGFVTTALTTPGAPAGVTAVIEVAFTNTTLVAADPPIVTVAPVMKPVPVIVTGVPPSVEPDDGDTAVTVGGTTAYV